MVYVVLIYLCPLLRQIVEEAGGVVTRMDGGEFTVFDRSVLVSNGLVHGQVCLLWTIWHIVCGVHGQVLFLVLSVVDSFWTGSALLLKTLRRKGSTSRCGSSLTSTLPTFELHQGHHHQPWATIIKQPSFFLVGGFLKEETIMFLVQ